MSDEKPPSYPLSDHTRRLRRNLIAVAAIGILLVKFPEITPDKIPALGIDLVPKDGDRNIVIGALNLICAYLLIFFVWNAMNNYWNWDARETWRAIRWKYLGFLRIEGDYVNVTSMGSIDRNTETFSDLHAEYGLGESKVKFWSKIFCIYLKNFLQIPFNSNVLFAFELLLPVVLAASSLYLGREHIQFVLARIF